MRIGKLNLGGRVLAAPLAGISNRPFRVMAIRARAAMVFTEMVSSEGIVRNQGRTLAMLRFKSDEQPLGIQLFGANPEVMGAAAGIVTRGWGPDLIDVNFGCPVKKVVRKNGGAAVLKDLVLTEEIVAAVVEGAGDTPVCIKMRTGWDEARPVYLEVGQIAQKAGVKGITLHARSRAGGFSGRADWLAIKRLKQAVAIAVIGNGDVRSPADARRMLEETGCDGVMIGRAALGNPFIFQQVSHYLETGELLGEPTIGDKIRTARAHAGLMVEEYGDERGVTKMRRCFGWYVKVFRAPAICEPGFSRSAVFVKWNRSSLSMLASTVVRAESQRSGTGDVVSGFCIRCCEGLEGQSGHTSTLGRRKARRSSNKAQSI